MCCLFTLYSIIPNLNNIVVRNHQSILFNLHFVQYFFYTQYCVKIYNIMFQFYCIVNYYLLPFYFLMKLSTVLQNTSIYYYILQLQPISQVYLKLVYIYII